VDNFESLISKAEISYKGGKPAQAIKFAKKALAGCDDAPKMVALQIFIARAYSKLGNFKKSNDIYRELLRDGVYIAPVVFGLFYNNFESATEKLKLNLTLVKSCLLLP
jgi:pentatricopeptide repeat protein